MQPTSVEFAELVSRIQSGDQRATAELVRRTQDFLLRLAHGMVGDFHAAQDLLQETYLTGLTRLHQLRDPAQVRAWLARILRRLCYKALKRRQPTVEMEDQASLETGPDETVVTRVQLRQTLAQLTPIEREAVLLRDMLGLSYEEMAEVMEVPVGTVRSRLSAGRVRFEKLWKERKS